MANGAKTENACTEGKRCVGAAIAPVDENRVRVERARVGEGAAQRRGVILIDGSGGESQIHVCRRHIVNRQRGAAAASPVLVGDRGGDVVTTVIQILVRDATKGQDSGREIQRRVAAAVTPVDDDRMGVKAVWAL